MRKPLFLLCLLAFAPPAHATDNAGTSLTVGVEHSTGDYGQASDTTITSIPFTLKLGSRPWQFALTVPYLEVDGPGNVTRDLGRFRGAGTPRHTSGLGDIVGAATRTFGFAEGTSLDLTARVKLGTADESDGLGTGENDLHLQADITRSMGSLTPFATLGYKILGDPPGIDLNNVFYLALGASRKLDDQRSVALTWYGQQKAVAGGSAQSELSGSYTVRFGGQWRAQFYGMLGLAAGSPDFGAGAFLTRGF
jgi:hypothetical protein